MITPDYIAKIEGHGKLNIDFEKNKAKLVIEEGERLFEGLVLGRNFRDIPFIVSRICGVCPVSHYLASIKALEEALDVKPSNTDIELRKILLLGQIAQSHILHTVFLALPDYLNLNNVTQLAQSAPAEFSSALQIKTVADKIITVIGGRAVHPVTPDIGGFKKYPTKYQLANLKEDLRTTLPSILHLVKFFSKLNYPKLHRQTEYFSLNSDRDYALYEGEIINHSGYGFAKEHFQDEIKEKVKNGSSAKIAKYHDKSLMVGALARIFNHHDMLNYRSQKFLNDFFPHDNFPSYNPFHNNFAQIIEILHCFEGMINILDNLIKAGIAEHKIKFVVKAGKGSGIIEAPRGLLYHYYEIDKKGLITDCNIITPTVLNLANLEEDANELMNITKNLPQKKREKLIEMLIRAYDPCITCSVH